MGAHCCTPLYMHTTSVYHCDVPTNLLVNSFLCSSTCCDCSHSSTNCTPLLRQWTGVRTVCDGACIMCDSLWLHAALHQIYCISVSTLSQHYLLLCILSTVVGFHLKMAHTGPSSLQPFWLHWWVPMGQYTASIVHIICTYSVFTYVSVAFVCRHTYVLTVHTAHTCNT